MIHNTHKKVSVIVPNYNYAHYLNARLASIEAQSYPIYEVIFLDDASSDESLEIVHLFQQRSTLPLSIVTNTSNSGSVFKQWIKGIQLARGEFIWIAEADDLCEPDFLEKVMAGFNHQAVMLSYSMSKVIDYQGETIQDDYLSGSDDIDLEKWKYPYIREGEAEIEDTFVIKNTIPNASSVVFRQFDVSPIEEKLSSFKIAGDWFLYYWLLKQGKISYIPNALNLWRRHPSSVSNTPQHNHIHYHELVQMQEKICQKYTIKAKIWEKALLHRERMQTWLKIYHPSIEKYLFIITYDESGSEKLLEILNAQPHIEIRGENMGILFKLYQSYQHANNAMVFATKQSAKERNHPWFGINHLNADFFTSQLCHTFVNEVLAPSQSTRISGFKEIRFLEYSKQELNGYLAFLFHFFPNCGIIFHQHHIQEITKFGWMRKHKQKLQELDEWMREAKEQYQTAILMTHHQEFTDFPAITRKLTQYVNSL